jgi:hypothetical protein
VLILVYDGIFIPIVKVLNPAYSVVKEWLIGG